MTSLVAEINRATVVEQRKMPRNVVTMNSQFSVIDMETSERFKYTLVYPEGDEFEWEVPAGMRKFQIAKVDYQPEARRHYRL